MFYNSGSYSWPKINSISPYQNYPINSIQGLNWFATQSLSASLYDSENDNIINEKVFSELYETEKANVKVYTNNKKVLQKNSRIFGY